VSLKPLWSRAEQVNELTDDTKRLSIHRPSGFAGRVLLGSRPGLAVEDRAVALYNSRGLQRLHPDWSSWRKEQPSKHAGSDPEAFWLRPVMAIMSSLQTIGPNSICRI